jgi:hypothetical protein
MPLILAIAMPSSAAQLIVAKQAMVLVTICKFSSCVVEYSNLLRFYDMSTR